MAANATTAFTVAPQFRRRIPTRNTATIAFLIANSTFRVIEANVVPVMFVAYRLRRYWSANRLFPSVVAFVAVLTEMA